MSQLICGDCLSVMRTLPDNSVDLTVTSPPYDNLRQYDGYSFDFENIARELYRITADGGVVVWVVGDATIAGSETGTSFRQALFFKDLGFNLHDTMIYEKNTSTFPAKRDGVRYTQIFEYMFVLSKGVPKTCNLLCDKQNKWGGVTTWGNHWDRNKEDTLVPGDHKISIPMFSPRNNIWKYSIGKSANSGKGGVTEHPAVFPLELAKDHILSWSNEGDVVLDCFMGSGTTGIACKQLHRDFIGIEISEKYFNLAKARIDGAWIKRRLV